MTKQRVNILIVDDYAANITAMAELLMDDDVEIFTALGSDEALEIMSRHEFGLAIVDVEMPGMDGMELARLIRSIRKFRDLPIIFATARPADSSLIFQGYNSGAVDVLFKPIDPDTVRAKVRTFVQLAMQRMLLEQQISSAQINPELLEALTLARQLAERIATAPGPKSDALALLAKIETLALPANFAPQPPTLFPERLTLAP